ncbi:hypothetical protein HEP81_08090 (plasmid) [Streptomyces griseofuscus]|uniref:Uncharacterized protein n=1 Tax=Streptomyces griseofuscus TaxID=146922 RepID=A0A7H1QDD8_9ACTN|nr:hypothetical protein [Streptomyces griseofuscus]QNT98318.1 hypothetical protein HEP81_08090 [Streptomyces griseofuscus]
MNRAVRRAAIAVADAATEGLDMVTVVIGGAIGAWAGYTYSPDTWSGDWRLAFAGGVAVVAAVAVNSLAELFLTPLRRLLTKARSTARPTAPRRNTAPATTLDEALAQVVVATEEDAAHRAASAAFRIDDSDNFLRSEDRWRGYEDGEASFYLAPGVVLHHRADRDDYKHHFTLLTGDGEEPVVITGMEQIRHRLAARAAGLPAVPATGDTEDTVADTIAELDNHLKALEA